MSKKTILYKNVTVFVNLEGEGGWYPVGGTNWSTRAFLNINEKIIHQVNKVLKRHTTMEICPNFLRGGRSKRLTKLS